MRLRDLLLAAVLCAPLAAGAQQAQDLTLTAPDGQTVTIDRTDYGVPRIRAATETALFFGQGFATAQDRLFQMETFWRAATGRLAELQGASAVPQDQNVRTVFYTPAERAAQVTALPPPVRSMMEAYVAGINTYIDSTEADPARYLPAQYQAGGFLPERWDQNKLVATLQLFMRRFGEIGGQELTRLAELEANGPAWFEANRPIDDPTAPTTIQAPPSGVVANAPMRTLADYPAGTAAFARAGAAHTARMRAATDSLYTALGVPVRFGSFAAVVAPDRAEAGQALLLGAPQMGAPTASAPSVTVEVELIGPVHVSGMTVPGIPGVIIGRTADRAWTLTTGYTDNTDTFMEVLDDSRQQYLFDGTYRPFEVIVDQIAVAGGATVTYPHYRTVHGPVYFLDADAGLAAAWRYSFWNRELDMVTAFYDLWQAETLADAEAVAASVPMSFNLFSSDREQTIAFWHVGTYPVRDADVDPRLPAMGTGVDEWTGTVAFADQPQQINPPSGYFVNWNNKPAPGWPQGDNVGWAAGRGRTYDGVSFLDAHVQAAAPVSFADLQGLTRVVRQNGTYNEYPGTYQQVVELHASLCSPDGPTADRAENVVPPGQSAFVALVGGVPVPSPNSADQWPLYQSSTGAGPVLMKPFVFTDVCGTVSTEPSVPGASSSLAPPAPNPVTGRATLAFTLDAPSDVRLSVVDALGREVALVADGAYGAGRHPVVLDTRTLAPGVYVVRLAAGADVATRRLVVSR